MYKTPMQMLAATMLSAQATDKKVNEVTQERGLFTKYKTVHDFASADLSIFQKEIHSLGFFRQKAKNIIGSARMLEKDFHGKLPKTIEELTRLPGVARKTANIVLNHVYHRAEGIAVDTHVRQVSQRFGFTKENDPNKIERDLMKLFSKKDWIWINYTMVEYNRGVHAFPRPECEWCYVREICPRIFSAKGGFLPTGQAGVSGGKK
ncbi:MAG: endonuclease III [bacterium]|nr:endonuclease III [bacterium]